MREVAEYAQVSVATVSHVINGTRSVSSPLTKRVLNAMEELDYRPDIIARSLRSGRTLTLGLMVPDVAIPFYAHIAAGIEAAATKAGYSVILCNSGWSLSRDIEYLDILLARRVDGLICVSLSMTAEHLSPVLRRNTPVVMFERTIPGLGMDSIEVDNFIGAYDATAHLVGLGHRRIACISGIPNVALTESRIGGYRLALDEGGIPFDPDLMYAGDYSVESGVAHARTILGMDDPPSAVFAFNDLMAMGVLLTAHEYGLRAPADLAVIGFDGVALSRYTCPPLSTVEQPIDEISDVVLRLIENRIEGDASSEERVEIVRPRLIARASTVGYDRDNGDV